MFRVSLQTFYLLSDKVESILNKVFEEASDNIKMLYEDLKELVTRLF